MEQKYWYIVRFNTHCLDETKEWEKKTKYVLIHGKNFSDVARQAKPFKKPYEEKINGITYPLKRSVKIIGTEFKSKSEAMDYIIYLQNESLKSN